MAFVVVAPSVALAPISGLLMQRQLFEWATEAVDPHHRSDLEDAAAAAPARRREYHYQLSVVCAHSALPLRRTRLRETIPLAGASCGSRLALEHSFQRMCRRDINLRKRAV